MTIAIFSSESSAPAARLRRHLEAAGIASACFPPRSDRVELPRDLGGIVFFDDPSIHLAESLAHLREQAAFLGLPVFVSVPAARIANLKSASSADAFRFLAPLATEAEILSEVQGAFDLLPPDADLGGTLADAFAAAAAQALGEMAQSSSTVRKVYRKPLGRFQGDLVASVRSTCPRLATLAFGIDELAAIALTRRVLGTMAHVTDHAMIEDCMGEVINVVAGQAKAILSESPFRFAFSTPTIRRGIAIEKSGPAIADVVALTTDFGPCSIQWIGG